MNGIISKFLLFALGVSASVATIEASSDRTAMAQGICASYKLTSNVGVSVYKDGSWKIPDHLPVGRKVNATGSSSDGKWIRVEYERSDGSLESYGWVKSRYLACHEPYQRRMDTYYP
jgi:hypothetical protein